MAVVAVSSVEVAQRFLLSDIEASLEEELFELVTLAREPSWTMSPDDIDLEGMTGVDVDAYFEVLGPMENAFEERWENATADEKKLLAVQGWLLGRGGDRVPTLQEAELLVGRLKDRLDPVAFAVIEPVLDARMEIFDTRQRWPRANAIERLAGLLHLLGTNERCYVLSRQDEIIASNVSDFAALDIDLGVIDAFEVTLTDSVLSSTTHCLAVTEEFTGDQTLRYGAIDESIVGVLQEMHDTRNLGLLFTLLLSLIIAGFLATHLTRRLRAITRVTDQVIGGNLESRIPSLGGNSDLDRVSSAVNEMLDHIGRLMRGIRDLSDNITHDLRTPLTRLRNHIEFLSRRETVNREDVEKLGEEVDRMLVTFSALLRIAQLEQGGRRQAFGRFDLRQSLIEIVELYEPAFADTNMTLSLDLGVESAVVVGDRDLWQQTISNLLENSLTYAADGKEVRVCLSLKRGRFVVRVKDSGPGIPDGDLDRVFERFVRLDRSRNTPGTGLGLSLVAAVCRAHNIDVELRNADGLLVSLTWPETSTVSDKPR